MTNDIWQLDEVTKKSLNLSIHSDKGNALVIQASIKHMSTLIFFLSNIFLNYSGPLEPLGID